MLRRILLVLTVFSVVLGVSFQTFQAAKADTIYVSVSAIEQGAADLRYLQDKGARQAGYTSTDKARLNEEMGALCSYFAGSAGNACDQYHARLQETFRYVLVQTFNLLDDIIPVFQKFAADYRRVGTRAVLGG